MWWNVTPTGPACGPSVSVPPARPLSFSFLPLPGEQLRWEVEVYSSAVVWRTPQDLPHSCTGIFPTRFFY